MKDKKSISSTLNKTPIANAGSDITIILPEDSVWLDGSLSYDPDGTIMQWEWKVTSAPIGFTMNVVNSSKFLVKKLSLGVYYFELKVTDNKGSSNIDIVKVTVDQYSITPVSNNCLMNSSQFVSTLSAPKAYLSSVVCNNKVILADNSPEKREVEIFDFITNKSTFSSLSLGRYEINAIGYNNLAFFAGGFLSAGWKDPTSRVDIYDDITKTWSTSELSIPRGKMAVAALNNKIFFAGGALNSSGLNPQASSRVDIYDIQTKQWSTAELSEARYSFSAAVIGNKVIFAGGRTSSGTESSDRVDIYDMNLNSWSTLTLSKPIIDVTSTVLQNKAYFAGNNYGGNAPTIVYIFDALNNSFTSFNLNENKFNVSLGISNNKIAFIGGMYAWYDYSSKMEIYDPSSNSLSVVNMNYDLMFSSIVVYNNYIYSFGGTIKSGDEKINNICKFILQ